MGIEKQPMRIDVLHADDVLADEKENKDSIDVTTFSEWVFNRRMKDIHDVGIHRVMRSLEQGLKEEGLGLLTLQSMQENDLAEDYIRFLGEARTQFDEHTWEEHLVLFLLQCGFLEPEIQREIKNLVHNSKLSKMQRNTTIAAFDIAAKNAEMHPIFAPDEL